MMENLDSDKKKYLSFTLQKFLQDWSYLEKLFESDNSMDVYASIKDMIETPEINWRFNRIICPAFDDEKIFGVCDGLAFVPSMSELLLMVSNNFYGYYFCKCDRLYEDKSLNTKSPFYFVVCSHHNIKNESDKFKNEVRKAMKRICENERDNNFQGIDFIVQCFVLNNVLFNELLKIVVDKNNYEFSKIKCLTFDGFKDSERFKCKMNELFNNIKEKHSFYFKF